MTYVMAGVTNMVTSDVTPDVDRKVNREVAREVTPGVVHWTGRGGAEMVRAQYNGNRL